MYIRKCLLTVHFHLECLLHSEDQHFQSTTLNILNDHLWLQERLK